MKKQQPKKHIFTIADNEGMLYEQDNNIRIEKNIRTFEARSQNQKVVIYELFRKNKARRIKTYKNKRDLPVKSFISRMQSGSFKLKSKTIETAGSMKFIYTNYNARIKSSRTIMTKNGTAKRILSSPQLVGAFHIETIKGKYYQGNFLGYSNRMDKTYLNEADKIKMLSQCENMARARFLEYFGLSMGSDNLTTSLITYRFMYVKRKRNMTEIKEI